MRNLLFVALLLSSASFLLVRSEVFTAIIHMRELLGIEKELLHQLNSYITAEKDRLSQLEKFAEQVQKALDSVGADPEQHLYDPVNAFQLTNRYTNGWMRLHENVYTDNAQDIMANISVYRHRFPTDEDYDGAIAALRRLQDTYKLEPSIIARGNLSKKGLPMNSFDCYAVGRAAYNEKNWKHTRSWMLAALEQFDSEGGVTTANVVDIPSIIDHIAFSEYSLGNIKRAAQYNRELLQHDPYHERALGNKQYFDKLSREEPDKFVDAEVTAEENTEHDKYERLCREADPIPSRFHKRLICFYYNNNRNPRLIIQPAKIEVAFLQPKIYIFHDFVSDAEIERLKELANPKMRRATARNAATGQFETVAYRISKRATVHGENGELLHATYRISKSGWLSPEDDPLGFVTKIDQRIEDTTGLDMSTAEQLQVVNYGIGGHYEPHYDFARTGEDAFSTLGNGNRVSTLLIYMSDVELGGATVFPLVGARLAPIKGAAAYWWNLKKSGEGDYSTRHAGCPVLVGSKWVCNKWIHERGQEFRRPCGLTPDV